MRLPTWARVRHTAKIALICVAVTGCANLNRGCAASNAENFGANWVITQFDMNGHVFNCWKLTNVSVTNEESSDGIYWAEGTLGHLVHVSGWYNRVQVSGNDYASAARLIGVDINACDNGHYPATSTAPAH